mmetsp:Transcript_19775/g.34027  ORF Transcript_19775/g.34027 Transcript_19775/m.34027 type:complete len:220 (+) Transcript_19775:36-695(+)|eukprot:CAMPEP_0196660658 /NCGR_PEP_ID=MMETSP1086-20130531/40816_1 /TAXON_ID=77921 /ORGANISM="Cyanoptyche  gloeocystis , Strain SAG4.97" /LENGTH=219 /DNA_ID=CAMNT_0041995191 /DNA_START=33 /DNA_END=692 /DNA_ORIENTATION=-
MSMMFVVLLPFTCSPSRQLQSSRTSSSSNNFTDVSEPSKQYFPSRRQFFCSRTNEFESKTRLQQDSASFTILAQASKNKKRNPEDVLKIKLSDLGLKNKEIKDGKITADVEIPAQRVAAFFKAFMDIASSRAQIPGFRKGHISTIMLPTYQRFVIEQLVNQSFDTLEREEGVKFDNGKTIEQQEELLENFSTNEPFKFSIEADIAGGIAAEAEEKVATD